VPEPIGVRVRDCACPGTPHADDGDIIYLAPMLGIRGGIHAERDIALSQAEATPERPFDQLLQERWLETFVRYGVTGWNLTDEAGDPLPLDIDDILANWPVARAVAAKAADLYTDAIIAPFQTTPEARSPTGPTRPTTSRRQRRTR
jgi:hypothetical protein